MKRSPLCTVAPLAAFAVGAKGCTKVMPARPAGFVDQSVMGAAAKALSGGTSLPGTDVEVQP